MPVRLMWRSTNSPTFPAPGSWRKGDLVEARPTGSPIGNMELIEHVFTDLTFQNTPDADWVNEQIDAQGGRRTVGLTEAEVDSVVASGGVRSYSNRGQFLQRVEVKKTGVAMLSGSEK